METMRRHGTLESIILNSIWRLEEDGTYKHSVKEVWDDINRETETKRAYTTIKTVMDRLFEKEVLLRVKHGKKFYYRSAYSRSDILRNSLEDIADKYLMGNIEELARYTTRLCGDRISLHG